jgi:hypothetical protein
MEPKTAKRRSAFRRANRTMPRRRIDIALEAIDYKNPRSPEEIRHRERQDSSSSRYRHACASASQDHPRDQAQPLGAVDEIIVGRPLRLPRSLPLLDQFPKLARFAQLRVFRNGQFAAEKENLEMCSCAGRDGP